MTVSSIYKAKPSHSVLPTFLLSPFGLLQRMLTDIHETFPMIGLYTCKKLFIYYLYKFNGDEKPLPIYVCLLNTRVL